VLIWVCIQRRIKSWLKRLETLVLRSKLHKLEKYAKFLEMKTLNSVTTISWKGTFFNEKVIGKCILSTLTSYVWTIEAMTSLISLLSYSLIMTIQVLHISLGRKEHLNRQKRFINSFWSILSFRGTISLRFRVLKR